jgi:hypothetical protein
MGKKELKKRIREELRADQAAYDERTKRLLEAVERARQRADAAERRESS